MREIRISDSQPNWDFGPVPPDEIAFAMSLFVAAAQSKILPNKRPKNEVELSVGQEAQRVFVSLVPSRPVSLPKAAAFLGSSLSEAFLTVWQHYVGDHRQTSICARVLGFQLLMERTEGAIVEHWYIPSTEDQETIVLHPAVIDAVAAVALSSDGILQEDQFRRAILFHASARQVSSSGSPATE